MSIIKTKKNYYIWFDNCFSLVCGICPKPMPYSSLENHEVLQLQRVSEIRSYRRYDEAEMYLYGDYVRNDDLT